MTGIGGGGLNVPMLMLWSVFEIKEAVPLSHSAIVGNAFVMLFFNMPQRHPGAPQRPLIHYELALLILPAMLAGSNLGVLVSRVFPPTLLIILSLVLLLFATLKTLKRGLHMSKANRQARDTATAGSPLLNGAPLAMPGASLPMKIWPSLPTTAEQSPSSVSGASEVRGGRHRSWSGTQMGSNTAQNPITREAILAQLGLGRDSVGKVAEGPGKMRVPWTCIGLMLVCSAAFTVDSVIMKQGRMCSVSYWVTFGLLYPAALVSVLCGVWSMKKLAAWHVDRGDGPIEGEVIITTRTLILYPTAMLLVGLVAGLLGLGGGEFMVPLLLEMGLQTRVAGATSGFIMLLTTITEVTHYLVAGTLQAFLQYASSVLVVAALGGLLGLILRDTAYAKANSHLIVYLLAGLLFSSGLLLGFRGLYHQQPDWQFRSFCPSS